MDIQVSQPPIQGLQAFGSLPHGPSPSDPPQSARLPCSSPPTPASPRHPLRPTNLCMSLLSEGSLNQPPVSPSSGQKRLGASRRRSSFSVADFGPEHECTRSTVVVLGSVQLGEGTAGTAFAVQNPVDRRRYCLKRVPLEDPLGPEGLDALCNEARLHSLVRHRNICNYQYSWIEESNQKRSLCILLERAACDFWSLLEEGGPSSPQIARDLSLQIISALVEMHRLGICHRDLSPWNVFLSFDSEARIGDFGLAVQLPEDGSGLKGLETPGAMPLDGSALDSIFSAPELGSQAGYNEKVDIYSLGLLLLCLWLGTEDMDELVDIVERARAEPTNLPLTLKESCPGLASLIQSMVDHDPQARPSALVVLHTAQALFLPAPAAGRHPHSPACPYYPDPSTYSKPHDHAVKYNKSPPSPEVKPPTLQRSQSCSVC